MKQAIIIFSLGLTLIIGGGFITFSEMQSWNTNEMTFEDEGYATASISQEIDITNFSERSISDHITFAQNQRFNFYTEQGTKFKVDKSQPQNSLRYEIVYYPKFGECDLRFDEYAVRENHLYFKDNHGVRQHNHHHSYVDKFSKGDKVYLDLSSECYQVNFIRNSFKDRMVGYDDLKTIMKLKKFPTNIKEIIITVNPSDENKLIK